MECPGVPTETANGSSRPLACARGEQGFRERGVAGGTAGGDAETSPPYITAPPRGAGWATREMGGREVARADSSSCPTEFRPARREGWMRISGSGGAGGDVSQGDAGRIRERSGGARPFGFAPLDCAPLDCALLDFARSKRGEQGRPPTLRKVPAMRNALPARGRAQWRGGQARAGAESVVHAERREARSFRTAHPAPRPPPHRRTRNAQRRPARPGGVQGETGERPAGFGDPALQNDKGR